MVGEWTETTWGEIATLDYGKALRDYSDNRLGARVFGTNGPVGWHREALWQGPGVIIGRKGAYRGVHYVTRPYWVIDTAYSLQPKPDVRIDMRWAYYQVCYLDPNNIDDGSPIPSTTRSAFYVQPVLLPPFKEQQAIAELLGTLDDKIELNRRMAETLEATARALFKSWFVDFDPVLAKIEGSSTGLPDALAALFPKRLTDAGLPEGWSERPLSSIGRFLNGLALQKHEAESDEPWLPVVKIAELRSGPTARSGRARADLPGDYVVNDGDHLFSWSGSLTHVRWTYGPGALNQHLFKVTPLGVPGWLTFQAVEEHLQEFQAIASGKAVTMGHIQRHHLDEAVIAVPDQRLLIAMDQVMSPLAEKSLKLMLQSRTLTTLRNTLLPKLISGELRIHDTKLAVAVA